MYLVNWAQWEAQTLMAGKSLCWRAVLPSSLTGDYTEVAIKEMTSTQPRIIQFLQLRQYRLYIHQIDIALGRN